jgi:hypothetical protein
MHIFIFVSQERLEGNNMSPVTPMEHHQISCPNIGNIHVYIQVSGLSLNVFFSGFSLHIFAGCNHPSVPQFILKLNSLFPMEFFMNESLHFIYLTHYGSPKELLIEAKVEMLLL